MLNIFRIFNVKPNQNFKINALEGIYYISETGVIYRTSPDGYRVNSDEVENFVYRKAINDGIVPIQLTKEQIRLLESLFYLGYRYLAKDRDDTFWVFELEPTYILGEWGSGGNCIIDNDMPKIMKDTIEELVKRSEYIAIKNLLQQGDVSDGTN